MVVRGDGALVSAAFARQRPIETILSGPAASLVGARHMTGLDDAVVSDIGGTTTDVAVLDKRPARGSTRKAPPSAASAPWSRPSPCAPSASAAIPRWRSKMAALDAEDPARAAPRWCRWRWPALAHGEAVDRRARTAAAQPQSRPHGRPLRHAHRRAASGLAAGLSGPEAQLYAGDHRRAAAARQAARLDRAERDAGTGWCRAGWCMSPASRRPMPPMCWASRPTGTRRRRGSAPSFSPASATAAASRSRPSRRSDRRSACSTALTRFSAEVILETAFAEDGLDGAATVAHALVQRAVDAHPGIARLSVALDRPVIGLGASAPLHYAGLPPLVGNRCVVPEHTDVANALGAVVGQVRVSAEARGQPAQGRACSGWPRARRCRISPTRRQPSTLPKRRVRATVAERALAAGTDTAEIEVERDVRSRDRRGPAQLHRGAHRRGGGGAAAHCGVTDLGCKEPIPPHRLALRRAQGSPPLPHAVGARNRGRWVRAFPRPHEMGERCRAQRGGEGGCNCLAAGTTAAPPTPSYAY